MLKNPEHTDIIAVVNKKGEDTAITVLQNVYAQKAVRNEENSDVTLLLKQEQVDVLNNLKKTYGTKLKKFIITVRNPQDNKNFSSGESTFSQLFN